MRKKIQLQTNSSNYLPRKSSKSIQIIGGDQRRATLDYCTVQPTVNNHHTKHSRISSDHHSQLEAVITITFPLLILPMTISNFYRDCDGFFVPLLEPIKVLCLISFYCGGLRCWTYCLPDRQLCHGLQGTISKVPLSGVCG